MLSDILSDVDLVTAVCYRCTFAHINIEALQNDNLPIVQERAGCVDRKCFVFVFVCCS